MFFIDLRKRNNAPQKSRRRSQSCPHAKEDTPTDTLPTKPGSLVEPDGYEAGNDDDAGSDYKELIAPMTKRKP